MFLLLTYQLQNTHPAKRVTRNITKSIYTLRHPSTNINMDMKNDRNTYQLNNIRVRNFAKHMLGIFNLTIFYFFFFNK